MNWLASLSCAFWDARFLAFWVPASFILLVIVTAVALVVTSRRWVNHGVPFATGQSPLSILHQHYRFVINGPDLIKQGYSQFSNGLFEIPRTFRPGQVILCKPELIEELKNTQSTVASPEPWIDQLLQISHVMPGYFPKGGGWPAIAKTTPGLIRGSVYKQLDRYVPSMNDAIVSQLKRLEFEDGECTIGCFDFAYSVVARSGSFAMVGERLAQDEEYLKTVKDHILGMIMTTRVQFLIPDCLKWCVGELLSRLATFRTGWNMHASRETLLKHFHIRASEYHSEMTMDPKNKPGASQDPEKPMEIFQWLYESSVLRQRWSYSEVIGEMLLLQFAFIYTTAYALYGALAELSRRPEYIPTLREEAHSILSEMGTTIEACNRMTLLDSFLKECQRLHPPAAGMHASTQSLNRDHGSTELTLPVSAHRVCIKPLLLSNGIILKSGTHVGVPSGLIQRSEQFYTDPEIFNGYRFVKGDVSAPDSKFADLSPEYLVFGMGVHACPGRWMASVLMKLVVAKLILDYDLLPDLVDAPLMGSLSFEEFYVPNFGLKVRLRRRL